MDASANVQYFAIRRALFRILLLLLSSGVSGSPLCYRNAQMRVFPAHELLMKAL